LFVELQFMVSIYIEYFKEKTAVSKNL